MAENNNYQERLRILLEDKDWAKAEELCNNRLNDEPHDAQAYLGLLLAEKHVSKLDNLKEVSGLSNNKYFERAMMYADDQTKDTLVGLSVISGVADKEKVKSWFDKEKVKSWYYIAGGALLVLALIIFFGARSNGGECKIFKACGVDFEMILCPAGTFMMGSPIDELGKENYEIQHQVTISKNFYIAKYPVTQVQYKAVMGCNPSKFIGDNNPVECVCWSDAKEFCDKLNEVTGSTRPAGYGFDLPTEAQWEYACRAGTTTSLNSGKNITSENDKCSNLDEVGWYRDNSGKKAHPVGLKKPNAWGIYDMHGNVLEWCRDRYVKDPSGNCTDQNGSADDVFRVLRGGSWGYGPRRCRSAFRSYLYPYFDFNYLGFRIALVQNK